MASPISNILEGNIAGLQNKSNAHYAAMSEVGTTNSDDDSHHELPLLDNSRTLNYLSICSDNRSDRMHLTILIPS